MAPGVFPPRATRSTPPHRRADQAKPRGGSAVCSCIHGDRYLGAADYSALHRGWRTLRNPPWCRARLDSGHACNCRCLLSGEVDRTGLRTQIPRATPPSESTAEAVRFLGTGRSSKLAGSTVCGTQLSGRPGRDFTAVAIAGDGNRCAANAHCVRVCGIRADRRSRASGAGALPRFLDRGCSDRPDDGGLATAAGVQTISPLRAQLQFRPVIRAPNSLDSRSRFNGCAPDLPASRGARLRGAMCASFHTYREQYRW